MCIPCHDLPFRRAPHRQVVVLYVVAEGAWAPLRPRTVLLRGPTGFCTERSACMRRPPERTTRPPPAPHHPPTTTHHPRPPTAGVSQTGGELHGPAGPSAPGARTAAAAARSAPPGKRPNPDACVPAAMLWPRRRPPERARRRSSLPKQSHAKQPYTEYTEQSTIQTRPGPGHVARAGQVAHLAARGARPHDAARRHRERVPQQRERRAALCLFSTEPLVNAPARRAPARSLVSSTVEERARAARGGAAVCVCEPPSPRGARRRLGGARMRGADAAGLARPVRTLPRARRSRTG